MNNYYEELLKTTKQEDRSKMIYKISKNTVKDLIDLLKNNKVGDVMILYKISNMESIINEMKIEKKKVQKLVTYFMTLYDLCVQKQLGNNVDLKVLMLMRILDHKIRELSKEEYNRIFSRKV